VFGEKLSRIDDAVQPLQDLTARLAVAVDKRIPQLQETTSNVALAIEQSLP